MLQRSRLVLRTAVIRGGDAVGKEQDPLEIPIIGLYCKLEARMAISESLTL